MKLIGIALIFSSATAVGFFISDKYLSMLKGIKRADILLKNIILGLQNERQTLSQIFENASACGDEKTKQFIAIIKIRDLENIGKSASECGFCSNSTANSILSEAFFVLGKYSAEEQIKELSFCRSKLQALFEKSEETLYMKAKLSRYSGVLAGAFFAIILF